MKKLKKSLAVFMAVLMIASVFNVSVSAATYTVTYMPGEGVEGETYVDSFTTRISLREETYAREHYTQTGWAIEDGGDLKYKLGATYRTKKNLELYPYWTGDEHIITYSPGQYGEGTETTATANYGSSLVLSDAIFTREGYTQTGWSLEDGGEKVCDVNKISDIITGDLVLYPYFEKSYTIVYTAGGYGEGEDVTEIVIEGDTFTTYKAIFTREGYTQTGWSLVDGGSLVYQLYQTKVVTNEDLILYPYWAENICGTNPYHNWETGVCTACGLVCEHTWSPGICTTCSTLCEHEWENSVCTVCNLNCGADTEHSWNSGVCTACGFVCEHIWENGICTTCGSVCGTDTEHVFEDRVCTICGIVCGTDMEHIWEKGTCSTCGFSCGHTWENGICSVCGDYEPAILVTAENYEALKLTESYIDYYAIGNLGQISWFRDFVNENIQLSGADTDDDITDDVYSSSANAVLINDIDLNPDFIIDMDGTITGAPGIYDKNGEALPEGSIDLMYWNIGIGSSRDIAYDGIFDGNSYSVKDIMSIDTGLFKYNRGIIKNLGIISGMYGGIYFSGAVCSINMGDIINCFNHAMLTSGEDIFGGICGYNLGGKISNCTNYGYVSQGAGICGINETGIISNCANYGDVEFGGVCTQNIAGTIERCYNVGNITSPYAAGGICAESDSGTIKNCYNTGTITGTNSYVGAICGSNTDTTIENCYYLEGCATDGNGVAQFGIGNETLGTATEDKEGSTIAKTTEQFASGEVCYLLSNGVTDSTQAFYQNIDNSEEVDLSPAFTGGIVYKVGPCIGYSNDVNGISVHTWKDGVCNICSATCEHVLFDFNGFCDVCGFAYEPAILVTEDNYISLNLTEDYIGYYAIKNAGQLYWFAEFVNSNTQLAGSDTADDTTDDVFSPSSNAVLLNDIDINPGYTFNSDGTVTYNGKQVTEGYREWIPIGSVETKVFYSGVFDGNSHCIKGVYINSTKGCTALFEANIGTIKSLGIESSYILGDYYVAGICGSNIGTIEDCYSLDSYFSGQELVGGICGGNGGTISDCYSSASLYGICYIGGICADNSEDGVILKCYFYGDFAQPLTSFTGGICGGNNGTISECYNLAYLIGTAYVGGICGKNTDTGVIIECYNSGKITGNPEEENSCGIAGICGYGEGGTIKSCYNVGTIGEIGRCVGAICGQNVGATIENCYYLEGCATDGNGVVQNGIGNETLGMATEDKEGSTTTKTTEEFASGEVCYLLNGGVTDGTQSFYQNIDNEEEVDSVPVFTGGTVYKVGPCTGVKEYTNIEADMVCEHIWENDVCSVCKLSVIKSVNDKTKIDHISKNIFTELLLCKSLDEIATAIDGYTIKLTASFGNYIGTGSTVEVLDGDNNTVSTYTVVVENDVNGDSVCDVLDCAQVARVTKGYETLDGAYKLAADSDDNGEIDANDYQAIVNAALQ